MPRGRLATSHFVFGEADEEKEQSGPKALYSEPFGFQTKKRLFSPSLSKGSARKNSEGPLALWPLRGPLLCLKVERKRSQRQRAFGRKAPSGVRSAQYMPKGRQLAQYMPKGVLLLRFLVTPKAHLCPPEGAKAALWRLFLVTPKGAQRARKEGNCKAAFFSLAVKGERKKEQRDSETARQRGPFGHILRPEGPLAFAPSGAAFSYVCPFGAKRTKRNICPKGLRRKRRRRGQSRRI